MTQDAPSASALRVADLATKPKHFRLAPGRAALEAIALQLGLVALRKLTFEGSLKPAGKRDWHLDATLGATVDQTCTVTLAPVRTRIDQPVARRFAADYTVADAPESEMPEDDSIEALGTWIDPEAIMIEALSLAIPDYPRAPDAAFEGTQVADAGVAPLTDEALRPFAGLAELRDKLQSDK